MSDKRERYMVVPTSILRNRKLSWRAKAMYYVLQSGEDGDEVSVENIAGLSPDATVYVDAALNELQRYGYLKIVGTRWELV